MLKKKKTIIPIIIGAVALIAVIIVAINVISTTAKANKIKTKLESASRYLTELDYKQAIAEFQAILSIDGTCEEAYYGLIEAFKGVLDDMEVVDRGGTYNMFFGRCLGYEDYFTNRLEKYPNVAALYYGAAVFAIITGDFLVESYRFEEAVSEYNNAKEMISNGESKLGEATFLDIKDELETKMESCEYERNRVHEIGFGIDDFSIFGINIDSDEWSREVLVSKLSVFPYGYENMVDYCYSDGANDSLIVNVQDPTKNSSSSGISVMGFSQHDDANYDREFEIVSYGKRPDNSDIYIGTNSYFIDSPIKLREDTHSSIIDKLCNGDEELKKRLEGYVPWEIVINTQYGKAEVWSRNSEGVDLSFENGYDINIRIREGVAESIHIMHREDE